MRLAVFATMHDTIVDELNITLNFAYVFISYKTQFINVLSLFFNVVEAADMSYPTLGWRDCKDDLLVSRCNPTIRLH